VAPAAASWGTGILPAPRKKAEERIARARRIWPKVWAAHEKGDGGRLWPDKRGACVQSKKSCPSCLTSSFSS